MAPHQLTVLATSARSHLHQGQPAPSAGGKQHQVRWTTALQGQCCHSPTTAPPLSCEPWGTATPPPAMGCCHLTASHGALPPRHQLWHIVTSLPTRPVLFMELLTPTAPTAAGDGWYKVIKSLKEHSRGQTASPNQAGASLSCTCHGHTKEPGLVQLHATPAGEKAPGKRSAPLSPVPAGPPSAPTQPP